MNSTKEYYQILQFLKEEINKNDFVVNDDMFNKVFLKNMLLNNPAFSSALNSLRERHKTQNEINKNIFHIIKQFTKKHQKDNKVILYNLSQFNLFYNEPRYIGILNENIYKKILESLVYMSKDLSLISIINGKSNEELFSDTIMGGFELKTKSMPIQFNSHAFIEEIYKIKNQNLAEESENKFNFRLKVSGDKWIKETYGEMVTKMIETDEEGINNKKRRESIESLMKQNKKSKLMEVLKSGIPHSLRRKVYLYLMGVEKEYQWENISSIEDNVLLMDYFILNDIREAVSNENYFLFEENLKIILFKMIRDKDILSEMQGIRPMILINISNNNTVPTSNTVSTPFPASGVIPFSGLSFQIAPFTYISTNVSEIYPMCKTFFCKYLSHTSSFTANQNSIITLIYAFNKIFSSHDILKDIHRHFANKAFDINPVIMFWISSSFAKIITPENVFILYDMIVLSDSLFILVLCALSVLFYRKSILLALNTKEEIINNLDSVKYEGINVLELINKFLNNN